MLYLESAPVKPYLLYSVHKIMTALAWITYPFVKMEMAAY